ncbi:MAG: radical SAM protein [Candidatus Omnitrophica bacterium]|nr:radical SAM protein [Candidatus Omnitrophota bacterium]
MVTPKFINNITSRVFGQSRPVFSDSFARLRFSIFKRLQGPEAIEWFPSYLCNSKCQYCGGYDQDAKSGFGRNVPLGRIMRWVKLSAKHGASLWNIGGRGGEPLLYSNLIDVLEMIKSCGMQGVLITNGLLLDEPFLVRISRAKWDILRISLDSHIQQLHDEIRGIPGNFNKIDKALIRLKAIKNDNGSAYPYIICCPVISNKNYKHLSGYIDYCLKRGVDEIQFMPLLNVHERAAKLCLSSGEKKDLISLLGEAGKEKRIRHNIGFISSLYKEETDAPPGLSPAQGQAGKLYCIHLWKTLVISEDGFLSPCSLIKDKLLKIGSSYATAWNSRAMNKLRHKISKGELISPLCADCCGPLRNETDNFNRYLLEDHVNAP